MTAEASDVKQFIDLEQLRQDVQIDPGNLTASMMQHTALHIHYSDLASKARRQRDAFKNRLSTIEHALNARHRKAIKEDRPKATEAEIASAVRMDPMYRAAAERLADAEQAAHFADLVMFAMNQRKDMLLAIGREVMSRPDRPITVGGDLGIPGVGGRAGSEARRAALLEQMQRNREEEGAMAHAPAAEPAPWEDSVSH